MSEGPRGRWRRFQGGDEVGNMPDRLDIIVIIRENHKPSKSFQYEAAT